VVVTSRQERERELRSAVEKRQFVFQYEPIYRLADGRLEGFEAFLRLRRADGSIESLHELYAMAEDAGMSILLAQETLAAVCAEQRALTDRLPQQELILSMNLTRRQLYHPDLITNLMRALTNGGADRSHLLFEAQESVFNEDPDAAVAILQRLGDWQLRVAVDDFGSSLAPLNYLVQMPVAMVKLAPRLTAAAVSAGRQTAVLESLVRLGNTLGLQIVAQGIQTQEQLAALARMGCALGQGPLFSAALDADDALDLAEAGYWALPKGA